MRSKLVGHYSIDLMGCHDDRDCERTSRKSIAESKVILQSKPMIRSRTLPSGLTKVSTVEGHVAIMDRVLDYSKGRRDVTSRTETA